MPCHGGLELVLQCLFWHWYAPYYATVGAQLDHHEFEGYNLCLDPRSMYGSGSTGLWVQLFILSKLP